MQTMLGHEQLRLQLRFYDWTQSLRATRSHQREQVTGFAIFLGGRRRLLMAQQSHLENHHHPLQYRPPILTPPRKQWYSHLGTFKQSRPSGIESLFTPDRSIEDTYVLRPLIQVRRNRATMPTSAKVAPLEAGAPGPREDSVSELRPPHEDSVSELPPASHGHWTASSSKARRASLPTFDPSRALENARDYFGPQYHARWKVHRASCCSEMHFKARAGLWTLLLECLPIVVSRVIVTCVSGSQEAKNRGFVFPFMFPLDYMLFSGVFYIQLALYWWAKDELDDGAVYEVVGVGLFLLGRAGTLAVKYAMYPSETLRRTSEIGVHDVEYEKKSLRDKAQMSTFILNLNGMQKIQLVAILYKSCLYGDVDLSAAFFHVPTDPTDIDGESQTTALGIWEHCLQSISEVYNSDDIESSERPPSGAPEPKLPGGLERRFSLHVNTSTGQALASELGSDAQARGSVDVQLVENAELHRRASSIGAVHGRVDLGRSAENLDSGVLLATFFRSSNHDITELAKRGQIPATAVALNLIFKCFYRPASKGAKILISLQVTSLLIGFGLTPFLRSVVGKAPFGEGPREQAFRAFLSWAQYPGLAALFYFNVAPILWYWSKLKLTREMLAMLVGREVDHPLFTLLLFSLTLTLLYSPPPTLLPTTHTDPRRNTRLCARAIA